MALRRVAEAESSMPRRWRVALTSGVFGACQCHAPENYCSEDEEMITDQWIMWHVISMVFTLLSGLIGLGYAIFPGSTPKGKESSKESDSFFSPAILKKLMLYSGLFLVFLSIYELISMLRYCGLLGWGG